MMVTTVCVLFPIQAIKKHYLIETENTQFKTNHGKPKRYLIETEDNIRKPISSFNELSLWKYAREYFKPLEKKTVENQKPNVHQPLKAKVLKTKQDNTVIANTPPDKEKTNEEFSQNDYTYTHRSAKNLHIVSHYYHHISG